MPLNSKTIFITGADGFIGSHLAEYMLTKGHKVKALAIYNSIGSWGWLEEIAPEKRKNLEVVLGDIRDERLIRKTSQGCDQIYHLAALIAIPYSYHAPSSYIETNITGTYNICQAALENEVDRLIVTSTSEVYGTAQYVPIDEKHPLQPQSPYSASKIGADAMAMSFHLSFNLPLTVFTTHCSAPVQHLWAAPVRPRSHSHHYRPIGEWHEGNQIGRCHSHARF
jgi:nucleoside-diphosphate-sugar epimerase